MIKLSYTFKSNETWSLIYKNRISNLQKPTGNNKLIIVNSTSSY